MFNRNRAYIAAAVLLIIITSIVTFTGTYILLGLNKRYFIPGIELGTNVSAAQVRKFNNVRKLLKDFYYKEADDNVLVEGAIEGMARSLDDPYTVYFTKEQMQEFKEKASGSFTGIGVYISVDPADHLITVISPIKGAPAEQVGILPGDKIVKVDNKDVTGEADEDKVVNMIRGIEGTKVKITVYRPSSNEFLDFDIVRQIIRIENVESEIIEGNIGYIKIIQFVEGVSADFVEQLNNLTKTGIAGIIIDVRDNPGGIYQEVVAVCDALLPEGVIVYTEDRYGNKQYEYSDAKHIERPIVVLVNGYSASASEILAGALKDHKKAVIVGKKTFGKGLVQNLIDLEDSSGLKLTVSRYFTPAGVCIQGEGIKPNVEVDLSKQDAEKSVHQVERQNDTQFLRAVELLQPHTIQ